MEKRLTVAGAASPDAPRLSVSTWLALFGAYWVDGGGDCVGDPARVAGGLASFIVYDLRAVAF